MWFRLQGNRFMDRCASDGCSKQPTWRLDAGGAGSEFCSGCKEKLEATQASDERAWMAREYRHGGERLS